MEFRLRSDKCSSFKDFTSLLKSLLEVTMPGVTFMPAFSQGSEPNLDRNPIITYKIDKRFPADKEIKPQYRQTIITEEQEHIDIYGQKFDYIVEFKTWGHSNEQADDILDEFEDIINTYKGDLMNSGVQKISFLEQFSEEETDWKNKLICRSVRYLVRLERQTVMKKSLLNTITIRTEQGLILKITNKEE